MKTISIIDLTSSPHFKEVLDGFLSHRSDRYKIVDYKTNKNYRKDPVIVLGAHRRPELLDKLNVDPKNIIIYNLEQFAKNYNWLGPVYRSILTKYSVLDYSKQNSFFYEGIGKRVSYMPVPLFDTFLDEFAVVNTSAYTDVSYDLIIFGMESKRRRDIANLLNKAGVSVAYGTNLWGKTRYDAIKSATAVLNLHVNEGGFLETTRLNYCIENGFNVISEGASNDDLMDVYGKYVYFLKTNDIVVEIKKFLADIALNKKSRLDQRASIKSQLGDFLIDSALDDVFSESENLILDKNSDVNFDTAIHFSNLEMASPDNGLAFDDLLQLIKMINFESNDSDDAKHAQSMLNKYPYFVGDEHREFWVNLISKVGNSSSKFMTALYSIYAPLILSEGELNAKDLLKHSKDIGAGFMNVIGSLIRGLDSQKFESFAVDVYRHIPKSFDQITQGVVDQVISEMVKRGMFEAAYRLLLFILKTSANVEARTVANAAAICYDKGDLLNAIKFAKQAVSSGLTSQGLVNLAKTTSRKYPEEYLTATLEYQSALKDVPSSDKVMIELSRHSDPAMFIESHKINHYGSYLSNTYDLNFDFQQFGGVVYAADKMVEFNKEKLAPVKFLAIVGHYNESDILTACVKSLKLQGAEVVVVDNWSDDDHYDRALQLSRDFDFDLVRFPEQYSDKYEWGKILDFKSEIASKYNGYWVAHQDADEVRLSSLLGFDFSEVLAYADFLGFNALDHLVLNVRPTTDHFDGSINPFMMFSYFQFGGTDLTKQIKTWKQGERRVDLSSTGGHSVSFLNRKVFPLKQFLFHFPLRSVDQATKKIFRDRLPRFTEEERNRGWHVHYDDFIKNQENKVSLFDKHSLLHISDLRILTNKKLLRDE